MAPWVGPSALQALTLLSSSQKAEYASWPLPSASELLLAACGASSPASLGPTNPTSLLRDSQVTGWMHSFIKTHIEQNVAMKIVAHRSRATVPKNWLTMVYCYLLWALLPSGWDLWRPSHLQEAKGQVSKGVRTPMVRKGAERGQREGTWWGGAFSGS